MAVAIKRVKRDFERKLCYSVDDDIWEKEYQIIMPMQILISIFDYSLPVHDPVTTNSHRNQTFLDLTLEELRAAIEVERGSRPYITS